jgi:hypothetical protein
MHNILFRHRPSLCALLDPSLDVTDKASCNSSLHASQGRCLSPLIRPTCVRTSVPPYRNENVTQIRKRMTKVTYNVRDSPVVTHPSTNLTVTGFSMGERTGSRIFQYLWSYVMNLGFDLLICDPSSASSSSRGVGRVTALHMTSTLEVTQHNVNSVHYPSAPTQYIH